MHHLPWLPKKILSRAFDDEEMSVICKTAYKIKFQLIIREKY
jgi:hypothetical protein